VTVDILGFSVDYRMAR